MLRNKNYLVNINEDGVVFVLPATWDEKTPGAPIEWAEKWLDTTDPEIVALAEHLRWFLSLVEGRVSDEQSA